VRGLEMMNVLSSARFDLVFFSSVFNESFWGRKVVGRAIRKAIFMLFGLFTSACRFLMCFAIFVFKYISCVAAKYVCFFLSFFVCFLAHSLCPQIVIFFVVCVVSFFAQQRCLIVGFLLQPSSWVTS
jgi:hypothetical protein